MGFLGKVWAFFLDIAQTLVFAAAVFIIIYWQFFRPFQVDGSSMLPTFHNKEFILTNLISLKFSQPNLGDVIVFIAPDAPDKDYIKRIVGLPGDTILLRDGDVYINDKKLDEKEYINPSTRTNGGAFIQEGTPFVVPQEAYFVLGDNRGASSDSRAFGPVKKGALIGLSMFVYWPPDRVRGVKNPFNL